ncbi:MAG: hypothetical protein RBT70_01350 [Alphaproteobacteria bacterium]|nr:hypothetical protein [Alphaproteobacteria bacterium]
MTNLLGIRMLARAVALSLALCLFAVSALACPPIKGEDVNMDRVMAYRGVAIQLGLGCPVSYTKQKKGKVKTEEVVFLAPEDAAGYIEENPENKETEEAATPKEKCPRGLMINFYDTARNPNAHVDRYAHRFAKDINMTEMSKADVVLSIDTRKNLKLGTWYVVKFMKVQKGNACDGVALFRMHDRTSIAAITYMSDKSIENADVHEFIKINGVDFYY